MSKQHAAVQDTHIFKRMPNFSLSFNILHCFGFEPEIILKLFLNIEGVKTSENQRIILKSLLMSYFIIKYNKSGAE